MFAWLPAQHLQRLPVGGLGAVALPTSWFDSGCGSSTAKARWLLDGRIEVNGTEHGAPAPDVHQWDGLITAAAKKHGVPPQLIAGIMATESGGKAGLSSYAGAGGLMGLMPATASDQAGRTVTFQELISDHALNVDLGTKLIAYLLKHYNGNIVKVALSYNAGSVKCGAPKKCPDSPNQWNAVTDCTGPGGVGGKAVDYPARMFKYSNDWLKDGPKIDLKPLVPNLSGIGASVFVQLLVVSAVGYVAYRGLSGSKVFENPFAASRCCVCGGPIVSHARRLPIWMHDNSGGWYAGRQIDHDACGPDELCANPKGGCR